MKSGRQTLADIERSIAELRAQENRLLEDVGEIDSELVRLLDERTGAFAKLAELRAREAVADGVIDQADALQQRVEALLKARQKTIDELKRREANTNGRHEQLEAVAEALRDEIEALEKQLDEVAQVATRELESDPGFIELQQALDETQKVYQFALAKNQRAEQDRIKKGAAYEGDPLFMYLWERRYGSSEYRPNWLIRMGDDWIARKIRYNDARANYSVLNEIPRRLAEHVDDLAADLARAEAAISAAKADRIRKLAGKDLTAALTDARERQSRNNAELEATEVETNEIGPQLLRYAEGRDESFQEAVKLLTTFLEHETYRELMNGARRTVEPNDDRIVSRIGEIDRKTDELRERLAKHRADLEKVSRKRRELIEIAQRYRRRHYDDVSSEFDLDDIGEELLKALLRGAITAAEYWARAQRGHKWKDRPADPFRRGAGLPPFGGGWGRRGSRRGKSGGFRTGGGF